MSRVESVSLVDTHPCLGKHCDEDVRSLVLIEPFSQSPEEVVQEPIVEKVEANDPIARGRIGQHITNMILAPSPAQVISTEEK